MDSLLKSIIECYPEQTIEKIISPSYVEIYTKNSDEIIMVYNKFKQSCNPTVADGINYKNEKDELELTGSPLKLDLSLHTVLDDTFVSEDPQIWRKEETLHGPVDVEKAIEILNHFNKSLADLDKSHSIPVWALCHSKKMNFMLIAVHPSEDWFTRSIVTYEGVSTLEEVEIRKLIKQFSDHVDVTEDLVTVKVDSRLVISGVSYRTCTMEEQLNAPSGGVTELFSEWDSSTLVTPYMNCKINLVQEVIIGHLASPCNAIWKSVTSLHTINQLLVDMTAAGFSSLNLETIVIRTIVTGMNRQDNTKRLQNLLNEVETYNYTAEYPAGGCTCVTEDTSSLQQCMTAMAEHGSSNDFTYKLWDILRDCETAEELITLLIDALTFISSGKVRPFIDVNNKTFLSKLVLKLSRGHSQSSKVLKNLRTSPPQALSLIAQVGVEKTMWEYTRVLSLLEHSFFIAGIWNTDIRSHESVEQINQTIHDMTTGGDFTLNPFESLAPTEHSIRLDSESFCIDDPNELTVDDFASLKKHGLVTDKKDDNEVPLIADEIDISGWKNLLMKFAQTHVVLEHLYQAETSLKSDFAQLKPIASQLFEHYLSEKSPVKTVGQLMSDPIQKITMPIANNLVQDHIKKPAMWYRMELNRKKTKRPLKRNRKVIYVFSQQPVYPPFVWENMDPTIADAAETTAIEGLKYHKTQYVFVNHKLKRKLDSS